MKLTTKILSGLALSAMLATAATAQMQDKGFQGKGNMACDAKSSKMQGHEAHKGGHGILSLLQKLSLSDKQEKDIKTIMLESMKQRESKYSAFSEDGFDKSKYIKQMKNADETRIKHHADMIEKVYAVLTPKQKSQLRVLMDLKEEKMKEGCAFDKNCNGRR